ncbi:Protein MGA2 [Nakaseomyces bracarensis]|uniref:Protein MGA2 n=1 Tax=Nakaseomyces bracarensis TaxID=273131 RepID=A0ABR4NYH4_9SACH
MDYLRGDTMFDLDMLGYLEGSENGRYGYEQEQEQEQEQHNNENMNESHSNLNEDPVLFNHGTKDETEFLDAFLTGDFTTTSAQNDILDISPPGDQEMELQANLGGHDLQMNANILANSNSTINTNTEPHAVTNNNMNANMNNNNMNANMNNNDIHTPLSQPHRGQQYSPHNRTTPTQSTHQTKSAKQETLKFGRSSAIDSIYVNPTDFLEIDESKLTHKLEVSGLPSVSRVENQLKLEFQLSPGVATARDIHLSPDCIARQKFYLDKNIKEYPQELQESLLYLDAFLICATNRKSIDVCTKCVRREQRRAARRKSGISDNMLWCNNNNRRAVIFNNKQIIHSQFNSASGKQTFSLTTRIVCYCRHHKSLEGFKVLFVLKDYNNEILAKTVTTPIMITDRKLFFNNSNGQTVNNSITHSLSNSMSNSMVSVDEGMMKQSTDYDTDASKETALYSEHAIESSGATSASDMNHLPHNNTTGSETKMDSVSPDFNTTQQDVMMSKQNTQNVTNQYITKQNNDNEQLNLTNRKGHIPSPTSMSEDGSDQHHLMMSALDIRSSRVPVSNNSRKRSRIQLDNLNSTPTQNIPRSLSRTSMSSSYQSAPSPSHLTPGHIMNSIADTQIRNSPIASSNPALYDKLPVIHKVIPSQGPINGGIEVTLLGVKFKEGLIVKFGDNIALSTQCWSESTIITYLPPAVCAGQVFVTVTNPDDTPEMQLLANQTKKAIFTYVDNTDRQLIELALQIVGLKMNGRLEDARNIAKRIVGNDGSSPGMGRSNDSSPNNYNGNVSNDSLDSQIRYSDEVLILKVIKGLNTTSNLSMCDTLGRNLLHLASLKGYFKLVSALIKKGTRLDDRDTFDFTPLHFACVSGDYRIIKLLIECGASTNIMSKNGLLPEDLFLLNHNTGNKKFSEHVSEVMNLFSKAGKVEDDKFGYHMGRKSSTSSFNSSLFDSDSINSFDDDLPPSEANDQNNLFLSEESDYDQSDFEEDGDEELLPIETHEPSEENNTPESNIETIPSQDNPDVQPESSLWNRMLNRINDDLPKYEDLFPRPAAGNTENSAKIQEVTSSESAFHRDLSHTEESQTSSEDEEEALQRGINKFFQNRQKFQNDKMLLFFWIPLALVLVTWFVFFYFGWNDNKIQYFSNLLTKYVRIGLAKILLGNARMKAAFKEQLSNFQTTGLLNDLMVG